MTKTMTLREQAIEGVKRDICSECACRYYPDGILDCNHFDTCEVFGKEVEQRMKEWAEEDAAREVDS